MALGELPSAVDAFAAVDPDELEPAALGEALVEMTRQPDRLDAVCARFIAAHDRLRVWKREGAYSVLQQVRSEGPPRST